MNSSNYWDNEFKKLYKDRINIAGEWKQKGGRVVGYLYSHVPEELLHAGGILPVQFLEDTRSVIKAFRHLPTFYCYQGLGNLELGLNGDYGYMDGVVMAQSCDPLRKLYGIYKNNIDLPFSYFLPLPMKGGENAWACYREDLKLFRKAIEGFIGRPIEDQDIVRSIRIYNENRHLVRRVYDLRKQPKPSVLGSEVVEMLRAGVVVPREKHNGIVRGWLESLASQPHPGHAGKRLFVSSMSLNDRPLMKMVEELGAQVVLDDLAVGARYYWGPVQETDDPLRALSQRYVGAVPFAGRYPAEDRSRMLVDLCRAWNVEGAIIKTERYCDPYLYELPFIVEAFKEAGIPVITLDFENIHAEEGRVRTRIQAFVESI